MTNDRKENRDVSALDPYFRSARQDMPEVSPDLFARIMGDAESVQAELIRTSASRPSRTIRRPGFWAALVAAIGGWPAVGGLATAGIAGLWLGLDPPETLQQEMALVFGTDTTAEFFESDADTLDWFSLNSVEEG